MRQKLLRRAASGIHPVESRFHEVQMGSILVGCPDELNVRLIVGGVDVGNGVAGIDQSVNISHYRI